jgi:proline dehydrogenase
VRRLNAAGLAATIDALGEDVGEPAAARRMRDGYLALIDRIASAGLSATLSLKASALGLTFDPGEARANLETILERARVALPDPLVRIDMEGYRLLEPTLALFEAAWPAHRNLGVALQAYLHRTPADIARMNDLGARVRLVKGAYREPHDVAVHGRAAVQSHFMAGAVLLLRAGVAPAIATHDPQLLAAIRTVAATLGRTRDDFEFELLYGVRPDLQRELAAAGYRVRVYVPFGTHWARYFRRRMLERRENLLFALGSLAARR